MLCVSVLSYQCVRAVLVPVDRNPCVTFTSVSMLFGRCVPVWAGVQCYLCISAAVPFGLAGLPATAAMGGAAGLRVAHGVQGLQGSQVGTVLLVSNLNEQVRPS